MKRFLSPLSALAGRDPPWEKKENLLE